MELPEIQSRFGKVVLRHRLEIPLGQEALADKAGIHRTHLSLLERGKHMPNLALVHKLAAAFGITMTQLMSEVENDGPLHDDPPPLARGRPRKSKPADRGPPAKGT